MEAGNSHSYFTDKKTQAKKKNHNEHKVRVSSEQQRTTHTMLLRTPVPPCQVLITPSVSSHTELPQCVLTTHTAPIPAAEGTLSSAITELLPVWQLCWQNLILKQWRCFLPHEMTTGSGWSDMLSVPWQKIIFQGISTHNTMPGSLSTWEAEKVFPWEQ